jgi:hypothetical protein
MPQVIYRQGTFPVPGGGSLGFTWSGPSVFVPGQAAAQLAPALGRVAVSVAGYIVRLAGDAYPEEPMHSRFAPLTQVGPGLSIFAGSGSNDPILPFVELDTAAHWPPWGPGSRFAAWAARVGVANIYKAAAAYASHAHTGRHLLPLVLAQAAQVFRADLGRAVEEAVRA